MYNITKTRIVEQAFHLSSIYFSGLVKFYVRKYVKIIVRIKLITIPNFLRPYFTNVNFYTRGAVRNLRLKGR